MLGEISGPRSGTPCGTWSGVWQERSVADSDPGLDLAGQQLWGQEPSEVASADPSGTALRDGNMLRGCVIGMVLL